MAKSSKPRRRKANKNKQHDPLRRREQTPKIVDRSLELAPLSSLSGSAYLPALLGILGIVIYAYWPTFVWIEDAWRNEPDYSHGYLVPILACLLCWHRLDSFPGIRVKTSWEGVSLIALAIVMRLASRLIYADFLDGWSILPLVAGIVWVLLGVEALKWSLPAILFLILMIPLPYRAESLLSWKLQGIATGVSTVLLRVLGQPAVSEGHVILLGELPLLVEQECSGLRIFIGVAALAYFWAAMVKRSWVDRIVLMASVVPLAVLVNSLRITVVGLLYQVYPDEDSQ
ncbi:MAG: exosortase/archaeosortase family protein, partial [Pirellulales bacterium]|nr:exosortase/archaeosortase family protein [Pirellulales bacterium]